MLDHSSSVAHRECTPLADLEGNNGGGSGSRYLIPSGESKVVICFFRNTRTDPIRLSIFTSGAVTMSQRHVVKVSPITP